MSSAKSLDASASEVEASCSRRVSCRDSSTEGTPEVDGETGSWDWNRGASCEAAINTVNATFRARIRSWKGRRAG